jgi:predicted ATPase
VLSPQSQLVLLARLHELAELQSQIVIATHSPILLAAWHPKNHRALKDRRPAERAVGGGR